MSVYRNGSRVWVMDFMFCGQRIRETTRTRSKSLAKKIEAKRRGELEQGAAGIHKRQQPLLLSAAASAWLEIKKPGWGTRTFEIAENSIEHLLPVLGKKLLVDIEARDVCAYQKARLAEGAAPRTANIEVATLRQIMRKHGTWARIQQDVTMLPERDDVGRALSADEESLLLRECGQSRSRSLLPFVTLALDTGARYNTIRTLQWGNIDFSGRCLKFGHDKTKAGTGRIVPLNQRALVTLEFWSQSFPNRKPEHYVFPFEKVGASGDVFEAKVYKTDPTKPLGNIKEAWEHCKRRTRQHCPQCKTGLLEEKPEGENGYVCAECKVEVQELPAGLVSVRFHDLRHTAVSRMIAARIPLPIIAKIVGWSAGTMAKMAARYGHFGIEELRGAVDAIGRASRVESPRIEAKSPLNPPEGKAGFESGRAN